MPPQKYQQKMHIFCGYFFKGKIGPRMSNVWIGMINEAILPILNDKAKPFQKIEWLEAGKWLQVSNVRTGVRPSFSGGNGGYGSTKSLGGVTIIFATSSRLGN